MASSRTAVTSTWNLLISVQALRAGAFKETVDSAQACMDIAGDMYPAAQCYLAAGMLGLEDLRGALKALDSIADTRFASPVADLREQIFQRARKRLQIIEGRPVDRAHQKEAKWVLRQHFPDRPGVNEILQREGFMDLEGD